MPIPNHTEALVDERRLAGARWRKWFQSLSEADRLLDERVAAIEAGVGAYETGTWTPELTFATPGDLSVVYASQDGTYTKIGRLVTITCGIEASTFTHTSASGKLTVTGLPFTVGPGSSAPLTAFGGITKANYTQFAAAFDAASDAIVFLASGSAQAISDVVAADVPTGGYVVIVLTATYLV